jgi:hypothetical protein
MRTWDRPALPAEEHRPDDNHLTKNRYLLVHNKPSQETSLTINTIAPFSPTVSKNICVTGSPVGDATVRP